ncbi:AI-2E family transporter [Acidimicrobiia bacterium EGI L10123]|uniref:AI-2E family transporter n=1 Tax=Salinilacustrithrix flava TaxID=2957203 RepID=UPI003D7C31EA|nr:AI-2E family transporter [Acidimicrobiia bacterium EGI L10123]
MWERFAVAGRVAWSLLGVAAAFALVFWIAWQFRVVFPPLVLAGAIVFLLNPIVTGMQRKGVPRAAGTGLSYLGFVGLLVAVGFLVAPLISQQADELSAQWPELRADMEDWLDDLSEQSKDGNWLIEIPNVDELRDQFGNGGDSAQNEEFDRVIERAADELEMNDEPVLAADLDRVAADAREQFPEQGGIGEQLTRAREIGTRIFEVGLIFVLAPIIAFYLLVDLPHIGEVSRRLIPRPASDQVLHVAHRLNVAIGGFFRGQLAVAVIVGIMVSVGLAIIDLPFWLIVGMIAGAFNLVPLIGPWVGAVPGVIIALTTRDFSTALWVAAIMTIAQQIDNHFISPLVMQRTVSLHPAVVMLALLAGGTLGGFFGLVLAVPVAATVKVIVGHLWAVYVLEVPVEEVIAMDTGPPLGGHGPLEPLDDYVNDEIGVEEQVDHRLAEERPADRAPVPEGQSERRG